MNSQFQFQNLSAPVGSIISFAGKIESYHAGNILDPFATQPEPLGWMLCDGSALSKIQYPELYVVLGTLYGSNSDETFNIPDLRGQFPGGTGTNGANINYLIKYTYKIPQ